MNSIMQRRVAVNDPVKVEKRADGTPETICGYAAVFYDANDKGTEYAIWDDVIERIMSGAFDRAIKEDDVRALWNHDPNALLGRTTSGTVRLSVDKRGLRYEIDPPDTQAARDVIALIARGDVTASSFGFLPVSTAYRDEKGTYIIERTEVKLFDVSPVTYPAYTGTEAGLRANGKQAESLRSEAQTALAMAKPIGAIVYPSVRARLVRMADNQ